MTSDRDRMKEIVKDSLMRHIDKSCSLAENITNDLLANGVIVPPCKVGDMVYVTFSTFYAEYKVSKFIYDGNFVWAKLVNAEYEPQDREILRCISFDINKTIFLDEKECKKCVKY